jgi:hypothetical protein
MTTTQETFLNALKANNGVVAPSARMAKISRATVYNWLNESEEFAKAYEETKNEALDFAEGCLIKAMEEGNITAIIFYLKCQGRARGWNDQATQQQTTNAQAVTVNVNFDE